jgi:hypothetical protein
LRPMRGGGSETFACAISSCRYSSLDMEIGAPRLGRRFGVGRCDANKPLRVQRFPVERGALARKTPLCAISRTLTSCQTRFAPRSAASSDTVKARVDAHASQPGVAVAGSTRLVES